MSIKPKGKPNRNESVIERSAEAPIVCQQKLQVVSCLDCPLADCDLISFK
jgi:hypothetical protein